MRRMVRMVESFSARRSATPSRHVSAVQLGCAQTYSMISCSSGVSGFGRLDVLLNILVLWTITLDVEAVNGLYWVGWNGHRRRGAIRSFSNLSSPTLLFVAL